MWRPSAWHYEEGWIILRRQPISTWDALELIAEELEKLWVLKEQDLAVKLEHDPDADDHYVPDAEK